MQAMYGDCVSLSAFGGFTFIGGLAALYLGWTRPKSPLSEQQYKNNKHSEHLQHRNL